MTAAIIVRTLLGKLHILVISLLLVSFALSSAATPQFPTPKSVPAKPQSITRLSSVPTTGQNSVDDNSVVRAPETTSEGPVEVQNNAPEPQQSISTTQSGPQTPVAIPPTYPSTGCDVSCTAPLPQPMPWPVSSCGCSGQPIDGYQAKHMCPMCAYATN